MEGTLTYDLKKPVELKKFIAAARGAGEKESEEAERVPRLVKGIRNFAWGLERRMKREGISPREFQLLKSIRNDLAEKLAEQGEIIRGDG